MNQNHIWTVLPVAGCSKRMQEFKPLLPLGSKTILEHTIDRFREAGMLHIIAVTGHRREELQSLLQKKQVREVYNSEYEKTEMFESLRLGVRETLKEKTAEGIFISPGDSPLIHPLTILRLQETAKNTKKRIILPEYQGKAGHPVLCKREVLQELLTYSGKEGLRGYLKQAASRNVKRIPVSDSGILLDADTKGDYLQLKKSMELWEIPEKEACVEIWDYAGTQEKVRKHCREVADLSIRAGKALLKAFPECISRKEEERFFRLTLAGALLHDVLRSLPEHEKQGAKLLRRLGYTKTGDVVEAHKTLQNQEVLKKFEENRAAPVREQLEELCKLIVYCADRLAAAERRGRYEERWQKKRKSFEGNPQALQALDLDRELFFRVRQLLKELTGYDLFE